MLTIKEIDNKETWEDFLKKEEIVFYPLFQSWNWGDVQKKLGFPIQRIGIYDLEKLIGVCLVIDVCARRGRFFHLRHGPVFLQYTDENIQFLLDYLSEIGKKKGISFIRLSPFVEKHSAESLVFSKKTFISAPMHNMDGELSWILDIDKPEDVILSEMRKTHRYLIRKSLKMDIKIIRSNKLSDLELFLPLYQQVSTLKNFVPHKGLKEELEIFGKDDEILLFLAEDEKKIIGGAMIDFVGNMAIYHHGASDSKYKDIPVSYLIQWEAIKEAKKRGKKIYNFWGIAPGDKPNHPWQGHTLFKMGFGGRKKEFLHAKDVPLNASYWKTYLIESIRKYKKGY